MSTYLKKMLDTFPKVFVPTNNRVLNALIVALSQADDEIAAQIQNGKDQIFIRTATGLNLDRAANSLGVSRPPTLGLTDAEFQELIPNLSLKPKQIRKSFYDTADVFWGPLFSRANISSSNFAPFDVDTGDTLKVSIDGGAVQSIKVLAGEIETDGAATAEEMQAILARVKGATASILTDSSTGNQQMNLRTNTPGPTGSVEIVDSTMVGSSKLDFDLGSVDILDLDQRIAVYNVTPKELLIEIPAIVPALRRTLKGSHHFHEDSTIEPGQPPNNGVWAGSFFFNPNGSQGSFTITSQRAELDQTIVKGQVYTALTVNPVASFSSPSGLLIAGFGTETQEGPIKYRGIPNSNTVLIDPSYVWRNNHSVGEMLNVISKQEPYSPRKDGTDLAIYMTSPSGAREIVQDILATLAAAGIVVRFLVLSPKYKYIIDSPYITDDDAPSI